MNFNTAALTTLLFFTFRSAAPLILAAMGATFTERTGVVNIAIEGIMTIGAFTAVAVDFVYPHPWVAVLAAMAAGVLISALHAVVSIKFKGDQVVSGTAINILAAGLTAFLMIVFWGKAGATAVVPATMKDWSIPIIRNIPILKDIIGQQTPGVYLSWVAVLVSWYLIYRTPLGLRIRAVGEHPRAADTVGVNVYRVRYLGVLMSGIFAGFAGAVLSIGIGNAFLEGMVAGRGFIAIGAMIFGNWNPVGAMLAAILFGFADALQVTAGVLGFTLIPPGLIQALPYVLTMLALVGFVGRSTPPAASGTPYEKTEG
jgi:simple sugar transport system permease protein